MDFEPKQIAVLFIPSFRNGGSVQYPFAAPV
jgi:hypothetical protein